MTNGTRAKVRPPRELRQAVWLDFLEANQLIAAGEDRLSMLRLHEYTAPEAAQVHRGIVALRVAFGIWQSEAQLDAAHEASVAEMRELADALPDVPLADPDAVMLRYQRGELR